jgi:hypothetical protein
MQISLFKPARYVNGQDDWFLPVPRNHFSREYGHSLLNLREMGDGSFGMFRSHVGMTSLAMLNCLFQIGHRFCHMRVLASFHGVLQRGFGMGHKLLGMTLFAVFHCFRRVRGGISHVLLFITHDITSCPTFTEG